MDNGLVLAANATNNLLAIQPGSVSVPDGRPGAGFALSGTDRPYSGVPQTTDSRGGVTEMLGVTIRPGIVNVAAKETASYKNATEPSGSKWKWYHWAIAIAVLLAVVYGGWYLYKKYK